MPKNAQIKMIDKTIITICLPTPVPDTAIHGMMSGGCASSIVGGMYVPWVGKYLSTSGSTRILSEESPGKDQVFQPCFGGCCRNVVGSLRFQRVFCPWIV